ncbi:M20 family metallopeptidase [Salipiger sp. P9]|uniref:M20 aminoacylase family protein n=1 Tax=Salipiger pentaromativorans TaxID=2943193 RepID=UPI0021584D72|nr:M20 aminoacylase family protein [Salipiger pentaromativorans]MCR8550221.1 M20 family metallopeptidase [Salipiger pentaromativorans]
MPVINSIAADADTLTAWRRHLHQHPELLFDCVKTAGFVVEKLTSFGISEIHEGIAKTGVVAIIEGRAPGRTIGLRADMDALPMQDLSGSDHASTVPGVAHTCGHDGHTTMLLGAAKYLAETRNFAGRVALLFQPAEEGGGGGKVMVDEGIMDRFGIEEVYGIHNAPGEPEGHIVTAPGPLMASADEFRIEITGKGGHGAEPQDCIDPVPAAAALVGALQTIVSRNTSAIDNLVVSVTEIHAGTAHNIIPSTAWLGGTVRSFRPETRDMAERRMREIAEAQAAVFGCTAEVIYDRGYPPTVNHAAQAAFAAEVAREVVGADKVRDDIDPIMPAEDFSYMLEARPGAYLFLGQGDTPVCHHPEYDFNDSIAPIGASFFARLVETALPLKG